jgi:hypothetical protein
MPFALVPNPDKADGQPVVSLNGNEKVIPYDGDPNGIITATGAAIVVGSGASIGTIWLKSTKGTSNNEWFPFSL